MMHATNDGTLLAAGTRVRIRGLVSSPDFNGQEGSITTYSAEKKRYEISIGGKKKMLLIKPENVEMLGTKQPTFANIDDMMGEIGQMGLDPNTFANITPEQKQNMYRMIQKMERAVDVAGRRRLRLGIDSPSPDVYEVDVLEALVPYFANVDDMMAEVGKMGLDPKTFANITPEQVQKIFKMNKKMDRAVDVAGHRRLRLDIDCPSPDIYEEKSCVASLGDLVSFYLPDFHAAIGKAVADAKDSNVDLSTPTTPRQKPPTLIFHHDTLVAGYDGDDEYTLLGMAVKYAGLHGVSIKFIGRNICAKESRVVDLLANILHYLPEISANRYLYEILSIEVHSTVV